MSKPRAVDGKRRANIMEINPLYCPALACSSRWLVLYGGAGSGKSYFAAQKLVVRAMTEHGHCFLALRKVAASCRTSVFTLLASIIAQAGASNMWAVSKSDLSLTYLPLNNQILCMGLDDPEKIKSITGPHGGVTGAWMEEATEFSPADVNQVNLRIRGYSESYKQIMLTFNPISRLHWLRGRFFENPSDDATVIHSTSIHNQFLDSQYRDELGRLAEIDPSLHAVYALGEWGELRGLVYRTWPVESAPIEPHETIYGLDFGYNNPTALVRVDLHDGVAWLTEVIFEGGLTNSDLIQRMEELKIDRYAPIYGDCAEPQRIEEIYRAGFNIYPAQKSVTAGIDFVKAQDIRVSPGSQNIINENNLYKYREDRDGRAMDEPAKVNDHAMDAIRYALFTHLGPGASQPVRMEVL